MYNNSLFNFSSKIIKLVQNKLIITWEWILFLEISLRTWRTDFIDSSAPINEGLGIECVPILVNALKNQKHVVGLIYKIMNVSNVSSNLNLWNTNS